MLSTIVGLNLMLTPPLSFAERQKDWRCGAIVYQIFVDRFQRSHEPNPKDFKAPQTYHPNWNDPVVGGHKDEKAGAWTHELEFWGGGLKGIQSKLDYVKSLGTDVLYLTPIFSALTNHRYDTQDYMKIDPHVGTEGDFHELVKATHGEGMKIMLDGVFNHMGQTSPYFKQALADPKSPYRKWYEFDKKYDGGYKGWAGVANLPALKLENREPREYLWEGQDSVVRHYLREGIDGWRLDVAFELGPKFLHDLTTAAHETKPGSAVVGEISGYPADWFNAVDGVFNFFAPNVVANAIHGNFSGGRAGQALQDWIDDAGIDNALRSWLHLDNHDTSRIASIEPDFAKRKLLWAALFTLPGSPVIYYGSELGLPGQGDPANRGVMPWNKVGSKNEDLQWVKKLVALRGPALKIGDFSVVRTDQLIGWIRSTDKLMDTRLVLINPTDKPVEESFPCRIGRLLSWGEMKDELGGDQFNSINGLMRVKMPALSVRILEPLPGDGLKWAPYHRIP